jgi:predicted enzyme related to lactoylglutathione lyase
MPRPIHFEIHAADRDRCKAFYEALFGWSFVQPPGMEGYHLISTGAADEPGINGGLVQRMGENPDPKDPVPVTAYVCTIGVEDLDRYVGKALSLGGSVALPKMAVPGVGWLAYVKDTESNILGLMQNDPAAA